MAKLTVGQQMPDFTFDTPFETGRTLAETAGRITGKTALVFLRYYGCTLCQYDIHQFAVQHDGIAATGGQMLVVLQSDPAKLAAQLKRGELPFDIICDPEQRLYRMLEIAPAASQAKMVGARTMLKIAKVTAAGYKHGEYEGEELQLPAAFVLDRDRRLSCAHYGRTVDDVPSPKELIELLK